MVHQYRSMGELPSPSGSYYTRPYFADPLRPPNLSFPLAFFFSQFSKCPVELAYNGLLARWLNDLGKLCVVLQGLLEGLPPRGQAVAWPLRCVFQRSPFANSPANLLQSPLHEESASPP